MTDLTPFNPPLGPQPPNPAYYTPHPTTLTLQEKVFSLSGDGFSVQTTSGAELCTISGKTCTLHATKKFTDAQGSEIFSVKNKRVFLSRSFLGASPHGYGFEVKGYWSVGRDRSSVFFRNGADGAEIELQVKGDWLGRSASITLGDRPVASITSECFSARQDFVDKQTYFVTVAPNVDLTLIAAICCCLDEQQNTSSTSDVGDKCSDVLCCMLN